MYDSSRGSIRCVRVQIVASLKQIAHGVLVTIPADPGADLVRVGQVLKDAKSNAMNQMQSWQDHAPGGSYGARFEHYYV